MVHQSPPPSSPSMAATSNHNRKGSVAPRLGGSAIAGVVELFGFHPVDTIAKRLMSNVSTVRTPGMNLTMTMNTYSKVIFKEAHTLSPLQKYTALFSGLSFAAGYKILQRVYKFGGQPFARDIVDDVFGKYIKKSVGGDKQKSKIWLNAVSGAFVGIGEVILLPLDVLKIKSQINPNSLKGRGLITILKEEKFSGLYKGAGWTAARNAPGSFALFGTNAFVKSKIFHLDNYNDATFSQTFFASMLSGIASITISSPLDVIKTRLQKADFESGVSGMQILKDLIRKEGPGALFKGLVPKVLIVGPKLVFSFTIAQHLISTFEKLSQN